MNHPTPPRRPLLPILSVAFVGSLGFSIVLPVLVFVVTRMGGNALVYGAMGATYSVFQLVGAPILGRWSDRHGRRRILLLSQLGTLLAWLLFLLALYLPLTTLAHVDTEATGAFTLTVPLVVLFLARALDGLTGGNVSVANAYLADITPEPHRNVSFGRMAMAQNLGFVLGPAIAGVLGGIGRGEAPPVLAAIGVSIVAAWLIWGLKESIPCVLSAKPERAAVGGVMGQDQKECYVIRRSAEVSLADALRPTKIRLLLSVHFLVFLAFNFFYISFPVHAATRLTWTLTEVGVFYSTMGLMMALVQGPLLEKVSAHVGARRLVVLGGFLLAGGFALYVSSSIVYIYLATALLACGNGLMWPSLLSLISSSAGDENQGSVQGFASSSGAVASIVGLLAGGILYQQLNEGVFVLAASITVVAAAIGAVMGAVDGAS